VSKVEQMHGMEKRQMVMVAHPAGNTTQVTKTKTFAGHSRCGRQAITIRP